MSHSGGLNLRTGWALLRRRPVLGALCLEVLSCQCLSSLITFLFVIKVKESIPDDQARAGWTGQVSGNWRTPTLVLTSLSSCYFHLEKVLWLDQRREWHLAVCGPSVVVETDQSIPMLDVHASCHAGVCDAPAGATTGIVIIIVVGIFITFHGGNLFFSHENVGVLDSWSFHRNGTCVVVWCFRSKI